MVPRVPESPPSTMNPPTSEEVDALAIITYKPVIHQSRPEVPRRVTAPEALSSLSASSASFTHTLPFRPRNRSPFAKTHLRSRSSASSLSAPQMTRAHSSPGPDTSGSLLTITTFSRPSSPLGPSGRRRSPLRRFSDETYLSFEGQVDIGETISENSALEITPKVVTDGDGVPVSPALSMHNTFPRVRRRPSSPLYQVSQIVVRPHTPTTILRTSTSSPSLSAVQFNEPYPSNYSFSSSSIPSTPTSFRSRSPSISSLETIPDSPDAELEAENIAKLKAAVDNENEMEGEEAMRRRGSQDAMSRGGIMRDKRKRWSVCGAEMRGDLDLETIWED